MIKEIGEAWKNFTSNGSPDEAPHTYEFNRHFKIPSLLMVGVYVKNVPRAE